MKKTITFFLALILLLSAMSVGSFTLGASAAESPNVKSCENDQAVCYDRFYVIGDSRVYQTYIGVGGTKAEVADDIAAESGRGAVRNKAPSKGNFQNCIFFARCGKGLSWFKQRFSMIDEEFRKHKDEKMAVLVWAGTNDYWCAGRANAYAEWLNGMAETYPYIDFYYCTIGFLNDTTSRTDAGVREFNEEMKAVLNGNIPVIDVYQFTVENNCIATSRDDLHYSYAAYRQILPFMLNSANERLENPDNTICPAHSFHDVSKHGSDCSYHKYIDWAVRMSITTGTSANSFSPDASCTRAQFVTFLWRAAGSPKASLKRSPFKDVTRSKYFYEPVLWAYENGIVHGTSRTKFSPNATIHRCDVAQILYNMFEDHSGTPAKRIYYDVTSRRYYYNAVQFLTAKGIITEEEIDSSTGNLLFHPTENSTRAEMVTFLFRVMDEINQ